MSFITAPGLATTEIIAHGILSSYNKVMLCPNDSGEMRQAKIESHYGQPIFLEQCEKCGGIWFDQSELYRAKQGEAEKIELLDAESLRSPALIENSKLACPRDKTELMRFNDKNFPQGIILERCPKCDGFWLNRGEFTKYQKARERMLHPEVVIIEDTQLDNNIREMVELHRSGNHNDTLKKLANFLSTPVDDVFSSESGKRSPIEDKTATILNVITTVFRLFLFR